MKNWYSFYKTALLIRNYPQPEQTHDMKEAIVNLHELEYKSYQVSARAGSGTVRIHPKRLENYLSMMKNLGWDYFTYCRSYIVETFNDWLKKHDISSPENWAKMCIRENMEAINADGDIVVLMKELLKLGFSWGEQVKIPPQTLKNYINHNKILEINRLYFRESPEYFESYIEEYLDNNVPNWKSEFDAPYDYMVNNGLTAKVEEYILQFINDIGFILNDGNGYPQWNKRLALECFQIDKAIAEIGYPQYISMFGDAIDGVIEQINVATNRVLAITQDNSLSEQVMAISLCLNVMHVNGNIMHDYGDSSVDEAFLDQLHKGLPDQEIWDNEIREEFAL